MEDAYIQKIHCLNFKGFRNRKVESLNKGVNILIGDNDTGKSTILLAIDLVLGANPNRIESIGLDRLLNQQAVREFLAKPSRGFKDLPCMEVDLYLSEQGRHELDGTHNIDGREAYGIHLRCRPRDDLRAEIEEIIALKDPAFPYEYYTVEIKGFGGGTITPYKRPLQHLQIDNTRISNDYASRSYVKAIFDANAEEGEKNQLKYGYRKLKEQFSRDQFKELNDRSDETYAFSLRNNAKSNLETDLSIAKDGVDIENLGVGSQCFIRTSFALSKKTSIDVVLLEEPENHLSPINMRRLIDEIKNTTGSQVFVATHSSLVCSRLDLRAAILVGDPDSELVKLNKLPADTAEFFMKAPSNSVLEFVLSRKTLLVEGAAEYILMESFYRQTTGEELSASGLSVIAIGGLSFPRYLDIAKLLRNKVAVLTDNDGDPATTCVQRYEEYADDTHMGVFYDPDESRYTFEVCVYQDNQGVCDELFAGGRRALSVQEYMLKNKSEAAFQLAFRKSSEVVPPNYVSDAIVWIRS